MLEGILSILSFLETYIIPIVFAIGVIFFLYGFLNSFVVDRHDVGHPYLLHACMMFFLALMGYAAVAGLQWLFTEFSISSPQDREQSEYGAELDVEQDILRVPNVPQR